MFWLPPVRFSTTAGCVQTPCKPWASARAMVSGEPPGVSGTMILTGRSGKLCAAAIVEKSATNPASNHLVMDLSPRRFRAASLPIRVWGIRWSFTGGATTHADPRGTRQAARRRDAVPFTDPGAVRVERRVHALAAKREAEGVRGAHQAERRRDREEARHLAPQVLQDRWRHGGGVRGDEPGARQGWAADLPPGEERAQGPGSRAGARRRPQGPVRDGHA